MRLLSINTIKLTLKFKGDSRSGSIEETKVTLVFFLGGCTYAEISALRFLSKKTDGNYLVCEVISCD